MDPTARRAEDKLAQGTALGRGNRSESTLIAADVKVAERDGAGVGNVVGLGETVQAELGHDRVLDLRPWGPGRCRSASS